KKKAISDIPIKTINILLAKPASTAACPITIPPITPNVWLVLDGIRKLASLMISSVMIIKNPSVNGVKGNLLLDSNNTRRVCNGIIWQDRKSVVYGKSVDRGGRRIIERKK